jgi:hypothetical protein
MVLMSVIIAMSKSLTTLIREIHTLQRQRFKTVDSSKGEGLTTFRMLLATVVVAGCVEPAQGFHLKCKW